MPINIIHFEPLECAYIRKAGRYVIICYYASHSLMQFKQWSTPNITLYVQHSVSSQLYFTPLQQVNDNTMHKQLNHVQHITVVVNSL